MKAAQEQHLHGALPRPQPPVQQTRLAEASDELFRCSTPARYALSRGNEKLKGKAASLLMA